MAKLLTLLHTQADGTLPKAALETLSAAIALETPFDVAIMGEGAAAAANTVQGCGADAFWVAESAALAQPRYASDVAAASTLIKAAGAERVLAPATSRFNRALPGASARVNGQIDTHIVGVASAGDTLNCQRWFYRQRIQATFTRSASPWLLLLEGGVLEPWQGNAGDAAAQLVEVELNESQQRTTITGIQQPATDAQTIRPDAQLLFVAGAGWTKKQKDNAFHIAEAGQSILTFLEKTKASLGSSKSLVDIQGDGQEALDFMTHMNQIGQTGTTPRHAKGLATCCHGEEPHTIGWRFITERRAINLDPNCGWAQGKTDILYVADAFEVISKVNALL